MKYLFAVLAFTALSACAQQFPKEVSSDAVFGTVQNVSSASDVKQLVYMDSEDPHKKNWGAMGQTTVTVDGTPYLISWEHAEKVKSLKVGDKVNLHPTEFIVCDGQNDYQPTCRRLMKIYHSERRIAPIPNL